MLIITGPGRSGTSVLALFCQKMGYDPGGTWYDAVDAGLECAQLVAINDALLRSIRTTGTAESALQLHHEAMQQLRADVVKDPRFTFHPEVLRAWHAARKDIRVLVTYRKPEHAVASRHRQARFLLDRRNRYPDMIRCQVADTIETLMDLEIDFQMLLFPNFLDQFDRVWTAFQALGLAMDRPRAKSVWLEIVDRSKVHVGDDRQPSVRDTGSRPTDLPLVRRLKQLWRDRMHIPDLPGNRPWKRAADEADRHYEPSASRSAQRSLDGQHPALNSGHGFVQSEPNYGDGIVPGRRSGS